MIKPSSVAPPPVAATRPAPASQVESRGAERESPPGAFSDVLDAQAPRADAERVEDCGDTAEARIGQGDDEFDPSGLAAGSPAQGAADPTPPSQPPASTPMAAALLCAPEGPIDVAAIAIAIATAPVAAAGSGLPRPATPELREPRLGLDQELQKQLTLGSAAPQPLAILAETFVSQGGSGDTDKLSTSVVGAAAPLAMSAEARPGPRSAGADAAPAPACAPELRSPLGTAAWNDEIGARVTWMVGRGEQVASLRLSPENLGPVEVRIAVREGETSVWFGAANADTRAALEQSLPRLKEMLGASGLALANAGVSSQTPRDPQRGFTAAALARAAQESGAETGGAIVIRVSNRGLVDLYA